MLRLIQANLATFKGPEFDATGLLEASQRLRQYQQEFPAAAERIGAEALLVRVDESLALKGYRDADWYRRRGDRWSAVTMYERVIRDFPQTAAARASMDRLADLNAPVGPGLAPSARPQTAPATTRSEVLP